MRIQKWIKTAAVFVCAAGMTVSAFGMIHAAGQEPAAEPVLPTIQEQTDTVYAGSAPEQDATSLGQEKRLLPPCGVSDDADKLGRGLPSADQELQCPTSSYYRICFQPGGKKGWDLCAGSVSYGALLAGYRLYSGARRYSRAAV